MSRYVHDKVNHELIPVAGFGSKPFKELIKIVSANATSATFTNAAITDTASYDVYTSVFTTLTGMSLSGTTMTVSFKPVNSEMTVKLRIS